LYLVREPEGYTVLTITQYGPAAHSTSPKKGTFRIRSKA